MPGLVLLPPHSMDLPDLEWGNNTDVIEILWQHIQTYPPTPPPHPPPELHNRKGTSESGEDFAKNDARTLFDDVGDDDPEAEDEAALEEDPSDFEFLAQNSDKGGDSLGVEESQFMPKRIRKKYIAIKDKKTYW